MPDVVEAAFNAISYRLNGMTLEQFRQDTKDFEFTPITVGGEIAGAMIVAGKEVHCCMPPELKGRWFARVALRAINKVIEDNGEAISRATTEDGHNILIALGFERHGEIYRSARKWVLKHYWGK